MPDIEDRAREIVRYCLGADDERITAEASFVGDLNADSLDMIELVMSLEEGFWITIPDDKAEAMQTFGDAVALITATLTQQQAEEAQ